MTRPEVSLADLVRAFAELAPADDGAREEIQRQLGFETAADAPPASIGPWQVSSSRETDPTPAGAAVAAPEGVEEPAAVTFAGDAAPPSRPSRLERLAPRRRPRPSWKDGGDVLAGADAPRATPPVPPPLFAALHRRAILTAALTVWEERGDIDVERVVETLNDVRPLSTIPRLPAPRLQRPVQVLCDQSAAMAPYRADARVLLQQMDELFARDELSVHLFRGTPLRGISVAPRRPWVPWRPPPPDTAVLVVSTFGIVVPPDDDEAAGLGEWLRFAAVAREASLRPVCLTPFEAREWPVALARALSFVHWSEHTSAGAVLRALRPAGRKGR
jgi:hypothetical protein